jgi:hypothetical protein
VGAGAGPGGWPGRGTGVDLTAGIGIGRWGSGAEKAAGFITKPPSVSIVNIIMLLVFIFFPRLLKAVPPTQAGELFHRHLADALDFVRQEQGFVPAPLVSCHLLLRNRRDRVLEKCKVFQKPPFHGPVEPCARTRWAASLIAIVCRGRTFSPSWASWIGPRNFGRRC